jgi:DNA-binding NarL/FixJ family response regulator
VGSELIRVAVVEDHPLYRQGLMQTIEASSPLALVASASNVEEIEENGYREAEAVILDLHLPGCEGPQAVGRVVQMGVGVLVLSASGGREDVVDAIGAGASGYLTKAADAEEITQAVCTVAAGGTYVSPVLATYLLGDSRHQGPSGEYALTDREREILSLLADGETDTDIGERLYISVRTVRSHLDRIRDKTGYRRRADLTRLAFEQGAVDSSQSQGKHSW